SHSVPTLSAGIGEWHDDDSDAAGTWRVDAANAGTHEGTNGTREDRFAQGFSAQDAGSTDPGSTDPGSTAPDSAGAGSSGVCEGGYAQGEPRPGALRRPCRAGTVSGQRTATRTGAPRYRIRHHRSPACPAA